MFPSWACSQRPCLSKPGLRKRTQEGEWGTGEQEENWGRKDYRTGSVSDPEGLCSVDDLQTEVELYRYSGVKDKQCMFWKKRQHRPRMWLSEEKFWPCRTGGWSLNPRIHKMAEGRNGLQKVVLWLPHVCCITYTCTCIYTYICVYVCLYKYTFRHTYINKHKYILKGTRDIGDV